MKNTKRTTGLSIIVILLVLSNIAGIFKLQMNAELLSQQFTFLSPDRVIWLTAIPVTTLVALAGIWYGKRWGIFLAVIVFVVVAFLDIWFQVWPHAILVFISFGLLAFFCWQSRRYFGF